MPVLPLSTNALIAASSSGLVTSGFEKIAFVAASCFFRNIDAPPDETLTMRPSLGSTRLTIASTTVCTPW